MAIEAKYNALITARFDRAALERGGGPGMKDGLAGVLGAVKYSGFGVTAKKLEEDELIEELEGADILISEFEPVTRRVIESSPRLKLIGCCRTGPEASVDIVAASERGIPVLHTPGRNAVSVAEFTLAMMIGVARHLAEVYHLLKYTEELTQVSYEDKKDERKDVTSEWSLDPAAPFNRFQGPELAGKILGLVGFGAIGREVALRAKAFGMRILIFDPYVSDAGAKSEDVEKASLERLAESSDFVVMAAKVSAETIGLFSRSIFGRMKPTSYFINAARAALVDYGALYEALAGRRIAGAALDVYPEEPIPPDSPFRGLDNILITPHLAGASTDIPRHHSRMIAAAVCQAISGSPPAVLRNPECWERSSFARKG